MQFTYSAFDFSTFNEEGFSSMYKLCFGREVNARYFRWKYKENPAGKMIGFIAISNGTLAGFYGVIPEQYFIGGRLYTIYQSMDTMTHPDFQKKGLFTTLAEMTYAEVLRKDPNTLIIGIPGSNSYHGFVNKLQWKALHHFSFGFLPRTLFKLKQSFSAKSLYRTEKISDFATFAVAAFLDKQKPDSRIQQQTSPEFLNWRISQHPVMKYTSLGFYINDILKGIVICHMNEDGKCFIDWIKAESIDYTSVLQAFCTYTFKEHEPPFIYGWHPIERSQQSAFRATGFLRNSFSRGPFSYRVPFIIYSRTNEINGVHLSDIHRYDLQPIIQD
jgi:hypothetical protein